MRQRALSRTFGLIVPLAIHFAGFPSASNAEIEPRRIQYSIIVTGAELLTGVYADGHTQFITRSLLPLGFHCVGSISVDDRAEDMKRALEYAAGESQLIIVTGGLGPTRNDITRDVISSFTGIALREHPEVLAEMERRFRTPSEQLRDNLRRQARVPMQGTFLKNAAGTAVGLVFEWGDKLVVALPGPPSELRPMVEQPLLSYLGKRYGRRANGCSLTVRFVGLGQSQIDQTMKDHLRLPQHLTLASQFSDGRVDFTFSLPEDSPPNRAVLDELKRGLQQHLGEYIYATDDSTTLEQAVVTLLAERGQKLCLLEIGSGGSLAAAISSVGSPLADVLDAGYVSTTTAGLRDALPVADGAETDASTQQQLAEILRAARSRYASHWLVAIGPQQGEAGREFVEAAFDQPQRQPESIRLPLRNSTRSSRDRLTTMVLDQLRRRLQTAR